MRKLLFLSILLLFVTHPFLGKVIAADPTDAAPGISGQTASTNLTSHLARFYQRYSLLDQIDPGRESLGNPALVDGEEGTGTGNLKPEDWTVANRQTLAPDGKVPGKIEPSRNDNEAEGKKAYFKFDRVVYPELAALRPVLPAEYKTELMLGYRLLPYGEILLGKGVLFQRTETSGFQAHDDGWRMKFSINF